MPDNTRDGSGNGGTKKTAHRFPWLTGEYLAKQAFTFAMAAAGALVGASYMIGVQFTNVNNRITANAAGVKSVRTDIKLTRTEVATLATDVGQLKDALSKQGNMLRGTFSKQYGLIKDMLNADRVEFKEFAGRMEEATRWMKDQQRIDSLRMREEWRDWQQRNGK